VLVVDVPVWKRTLKWLAWLLGGTLTLLTVAYLALLLINWRDKPPSEPALRLTAILRDRPAVSDADNAWVYVMGFTAAPDADPREAGIRRVDWLRKLRDRAHPPAARDPVPEGESYKATRLPAVQDLADACRLASSECAVALAEGDDAMRQWIRSEEWLLDRYHVLLRHSGWLETVPFDERAPLPAYGLVFDGQKLLLSTAYLRAGEKDAAGVRELLGNDVKFWRHVLASSDILITKMIAVAALNRTFGVGNLVLRRLPAELQLEGMPQEWTMQLTDAERSLLRCFAGEWIFGDTFLRQAVVSGWWRSVDFERDSDLGSRLLGRALMPLFQPQDTSNRRAEMFVRAAEALSVPYERFPEGLDQARAVFENLSERSGPVPGLYNPIGDVLLWVGPPVFHPYGARVADVEGARRAAVLATELRSRKVDVQRIPAELAASVLRAPYSGEAFAWDATAQAIVFVGLEQHERGRHAFAY
jgi:hypothetical protein